MKLSWRDFVNTLLVLGGGAIVYAKFYGYSWSVIGSWRSAVAVLAGTALVMMLVSAFDFANGSFLNITEMMLGILAIGLAVVGVFMTSSFVFYSLASVMGAAWLLDTARHIRHSWVGDEGYGTTTFHHHAHVS